MSLQRKSSSSKLDDMVGSMLEDGIDLSELAKLVTDAAIKKKKEAESPGHTAKSKKKETTSSESDGDGSSEGEEVIDKSAKKKKVVGKAKNQSKNKPKNKKDSPNAEESSAEDEKNAAKKQHSKKVSSESDGDGSSEEEEVIDKSAKKKKVVGKAKNQSKNKPKNNQDSSNAEESSEEDEKRHSEKIRRDKTVSEKSSKKQQIKPKATVKENKIEDNNEAKIQQSNKKRGSTENKDAQDKSCLKKKGSPKNATDSKSCNNSSEEEQENDLKEPATKRSARLKAKLDEQVPNQKGDHSVPSSSKKRHKQSASDSSKIPAKIQKLDEEMDIDEKNSIKTYSKQTVIKKFADGKITACKPMSARNGSDIYVGIRKLKLKKTKQLVTSHYWCSKCGKLIHADTSKNYAVISRHHDLCFNEAKIKVKITKKNLKQLLAGVMKIAQEEGVVDLSNVSVPDDFNIDGNLDQFLLDLKKSIQESKNETVKPDDSDSSSTSE